MTDSVGIKCRVAQLCGADANGGLSSRDTAKKYGVSKSLVNTHRAGGCACGKYDSANVALPEKYHPSGWEPHITWDGSRGVVSTGPLDSEPDKAIWAALIADWGLDPTTTEIIDGSIQLRAWDANVGGGDIRRLRYYRASIRARRAAEDRTDVEALIKEVGKAKKRPLPDWPDNEGEFPGALVALLSDWQIGKGEGGGSQATVDRIKTSTLNLVAHVKYLRSIQRSPSALYLVGLGDVVEGCSEFYAMQKFSVDLDRRSQKRVVRRLLLWIIDTCLTLGIPIVIGGVPGNHGENRSEGKAFTTLTDNDDLAAFEELGEILAVNPERYGKVYIPDGAIADDLTMTLNVEGITCGFAHGHQVRGGGAGAQAKVEKWWSNQALGLQRVADAKILFTGHLHHFVCSEATGRTWFQAPAQDGGSQWYVGTSGQSSAAGMLVIGVGEGYGQRGWGDLQIL